MQSSGSNLHSHRAYTRPRKESRGKYVRRTITKEERRQICLTRKRFSLRHFGAETTSQCEDITVFSTEHSFNDEVPGDSDSSIPSSSTVTLVLDSSIQPALGHPPQCGCIQCHYCHDMRFAVGHASNMVYNSTPATVHYPTGQSAAASEPVAPAVTASQPITPPISPRQLIAQLIVANKAIVQPVDEPIPSTTQAPTNFQILPPSIIRPSSLPNQLTCSAQDPVSLLTTIGPTVPLRIETRFRLFNGGTGVTRWHKSVSDYTLDAPHPVTNAEVGDVYVHVNIKNGALQVWQIAVSVCGAHFRAGCCTNLCFVMKAGSQDAVPL
ncbi:hypothetical protein EUX98_g1885 [Antrodiella citrinella]|uniref:Uncharacterized protein n=1 Tax=Antrodiella citrinella TaxID=2447956 RepID=A0A4S4N360_9APHY|nr:hypothetical protein EUX98_g1885 [Antrodiella citrinella]